MEFLDDDWTPKPAYNRLSNLINNEWHTESSGTTTTNGVLDFTGYYGDYNLTIPLLGNTYYINAKKGETNEFLVVI